MMVQQSVSPPTLSQRELEVLKLLSEGLTQRQVAASLGITVKTVEFHRNTIGNKIGISNTILMVRWAIRNKVIDP